MEPFLSQLALVLAGAIAGWTAFFSFVVAPQAFRDLDAGRAKRFIRNAMRTGHPLLAAASVGAGAVALLAGRVVSGSLLLSAAAFFLMAAYALAPRDDERPPPGGRRKLDTARVVASMVTAFILMVVIGAAGLLMAGL
jgi:hypothetical protein